LYPDRRIQHAGIEFFRDVNPDHPLWPLHRYHHFTSAIRLANVPVEVPR